MQLKTTFFILIMLFILFLFYGHSDTIEQRKYDFSFTKSTNQYGVKFYSFNYLNLPPLEHIKTNNSIVEINDILEYIGEPLVKDESQYRLVGKKTLVWDDYEKGKLTVDLQDCNYDSDDKKSYTCIKRLSISPSNREKMFNQAMNSKSRKFISKEQYGDQWPFTVDFGILACRRGNAVIFRTEDHEVYALNGLAMDEYKDVRPIWKDDPNFPFPNSKISLGNLIREGLELCD
jgi:hypothetical protein